jgi:hypothetical protein
MSGGRAALFLSNYIVDRKFFNIEKRAGVIKCYPVFRLLRQKSIAVSVTGLLSMEAIEPVEKFHLSLPNVSKDTSGCASWSCESIGCAEYFYHNIQRNSISKNELLWFQLNRMSPLDTHRRVVYTLLIELHTVC